SPGDGTSALVSDYRALPVAWRYSIALVVAPVIVGGFGMLLELALRRTYGRDALYGLLLTFGAALVIEEWIRAVFGSTEKQLPLPEAVTGAFMVGELIYAKYRLFACAFAAGAIALLWLFLQEMPYCSVLTGGRDARGT